jgi:hypothetical protein
VNHSELVRISLEILPMETAVHAAGPFDMLIDPQPILDAVQNSIRLRSLNSRVCRPLDRTSKPNDERPNVVVAAVEIVEDPLDDGLV